MKFEEHTCLGVAALDVPDVVEDEAGEAVQSRQGLGELALGLGGLELLNEVGDAGVADAGACLGQCEADTCRQMGL